MLYIIGMGHSLKDISLKGIEAVKNCKEVYLESYTSLSDFNISELNNLVGKEVKVLGRAEIEEDKPFLKENTALLVYGDPLFATTHEEILSEAKKEKIKTEIIHAPSIFTTIAETGLQLYKFGKTASIPFWTKSYKPESFFDLLEQNQSIDAHTLFLLDLNPQEEKFLSISDAITRLEEISKKRNSKLITNDTKIIACTRLGMKNSIIKYGTSSQLSKIDFGDAPYCIIIPGKLNFVEEESLKNYSI